jgi:hypothetical protein
MFADGVGEGRSTVAPSAARYARGNPVRRLRSGIGGRIGAARSAGWPNGGAG